MLRANWRSWPSRVLVLLVVVGMLVGACAAPAATPTQAPAPAAKPAKPAVYKVGHMVPLTGTSADLGQDFRRTAELALEDINKAGGVNGTPLEIVTEDHQGEPQQGVTAFRKLADVDKVPFILSAWSVIVMATAPIADDKKVVLMNNAANAESIRGAGKFVVSSYPLSGYEMTVLARYLNKEMGIKKPASIYANTDAGKWNSEAFCEEFKRLGSPCVTREAFEANAVDYAPQLLKIKSLAPEILHMAPTNTSQFPQIVKQMGDLGLAPTIKPVSYVGFELLSMFDVAGAAADKAVYSSVAPPDDLPEVQDFVKRFKAKFNKDVTGLGWNVYVYDSFFLVKELLEYMESKGYTYTGENVLKAIYEKKTFASTKLTGATEFSADGTVYKPVTIKRVNVPAKKFEWISLVRPKGDGLETLRKAQ